MTSSSSTSGSGSSQSVPSSIDSAGTLPTQDCIDGNWSEHDESVVDDTIWGKLYPIGKCFNLLDLRKDKYRFGRNTECDVCFTAADFAKNIHLQALSKNHFDIIRETSDRDPHIVYIKDWSSNGTFLNGDLIGKGNKQVLQNNDEIQLARVENRGYVFIDLKTTNKEQEEIPQEVREKYTVSKILGRGACGEVRMAFRKGKECGKYAIKIINKDRFSSTDPVHSKEKIVEEALILKRLNHPCIVKIEDVFDTPKVFFIVLELIEGGDLYDRVVSKERLSEDEAKLLFYQMLVAVQYLHENGFIHRDLKPENVLLCSTEKETLIKITDFGVSKFIGEKSFMDTLCGTPCYIAPEVIKDEPRRYNKECDCWSLGVILFVCLGGYPPFADHPKVPIGDQILQGTFQFPDHKWKNISDDAKDLIRKLLTVDLSKRISIKDALQHPWLQNEEIISKAERLMWEPSLPKDKQQMLPPPTETVSTVRRREGTDERPPVKKQKLDE